MSDKSYSIDDILQEIKDKKISGDELTKTKKEHKKFDTQTLLDDILGKKSDDLSVPKAENKPTEPVKKSRVDTYEDLSQIKKREEAKANLAEKAEELSDNAKNDLSEVYDDKSENEQSPVKVEDEVKDTDAKAVESQNTTEGDTDTKPEQAEAISKEASDTQKQADKPDLSQDEKQYNTRDLEYMALAKTRKQLVEGFVLNKSEIDEKAETGEQKPYSDTYEIKTTQQFAAIDEQNKAKAVEQKPVSNITYPSQKTNKELVKEWSKKETAEQNDISPTDWPDYLDEYKSYEQTDETLTFLNELKHKNLFKTISMTVIFLLSLVLIFLGKLVSPHPLPIIDPEQNPSIFCLVDLILCLVLMFINADVISKGIVSTLKRKPGKDALYAYSIIGMTIFNIVILTSSSSINDSDVFLYTPALIFITLLGSIGKSYAIKRMLTNFRFVSGQYDKYSLGVLKQNDLANSLAKGSIEQEPNIIYDKKAHFLSDFIKESLRDDLSDEIGYYTAPLAVIMSFVAALLAFFLGNNIYVALTVFTGVLIVATGSVAMFVSNYPLYTASKTLSRLGGGVLGYKATKDFTDANSIVIPARDLFFDKNIILYGIKTFSEMPIDRAILDATSVLRETNSILSGMFMNIISGRTDILDPVDSVKYEDAMGISAWVNNRRVLIGSRELMINHNIDIPSKDYESRYIAQGKNLIYLSAEGVLSAVFVVGLEYSEEIRNMLIDLYNNNVLVMVKTVDPILTEARLGEVFDMPAETFKVIPSRLHKELAEYTCEADTASGAVFNNGKLPAYLYSFLFAKNLNKPFLIGKLISFASAILGILLFVVFTLLNSTSQLSNEILCFYEIISLAICLLLQRITSFKS